MATGLPPHLSEKNQEWVLNFCNFPSAWLKSKGAEIFVAHPDTGWTGHPELVHPTYRRDLAKNFYEPPRYARVCTPNDDSLNARDRDGWLSTAHGTGTAGVLGSPRGHPSNGRAPEERDAFDQNSPDAYVSGGAPEAVVIPYRVAGNPLMRQAEDEALAKCIYHCIGLRANRGIDVGVMSISLGGFDRGTKKKILDALVAARDAGIVMVAAAGQFLGHGLGSRMPRNLRGPVFPGSSPHTVCVAGCDWQHEPLRMAFYGKAVDVSGPAFNVWMSRTDWVDSAPDGERYRIEPSDGTSYSTALTAAACALWQSFHTRDRLISIYGRPRLLAAFRYCVRHTAHPHNGWDTDERGAGALDARALLDLDLPSVDDVDREEPQ